MTFKFFAFVDAIIKLHPTKERAAGGKQKMENKKEQCFMCRNFDRFYTKGTRNFNKTKTGLCFKKGETVDIHGNCEKFLLRVPRRLPPKYLRYCLSDMLTELSEIRKMLETEGEGDENDKEV